MRRMIIATGALFVGVLKLAMLHGHAALDLSYMYMTVCNLYMYTYIFACKSTVDG